VRHGSDVTQGGGPFEPTAGSQDVLARATVGIAVQEEESEVGLGVHVVLASGQLVPAPGGGKVDLLVEEAELEDVSQGELPVGIAVHGLANKGIDAGHDSGAGLPWVSDVRPIP